MKQNNVKSYTAYRHRNFFWVHLKRKTLRILKLFPEKGSSQTVLSDYFHFTFLCLPGFYIRKIFTLSIYGSKRFHIEQSKRWKKKDTKFKWQTWYFNLEEYSIKLNFKTIYIINFLFVVVILLDNNYCVFFFCVMFFIHQKFVLKNQFLVFNWFACFRIKCTDSLNIFQMYFASFLWLVG